MAEPAPRILIIRPSALGDVCRTVPVLASLRAHWPASHIAWVVQDDFAPAIAAHPALNEIIGFPRGRFAQWWSSPQRTREMRAWFGTLRARRFDIALDCQGLSRSGLIAAASGARTRVGLRSAREFAWLCYNHRVPMAGGEPPAHTVDQMLALLQPLGVPALPDMRLSVCEQDETWWSMQRKALAIDPGERYAVIAPGSRWRSKRWPIERFSELVEPILGRGFSRVLVIGSPAERDQVQGFLSRFHVANGSGKGGDSFAQQKDQPVIDLVGRTSIGQTMAMIAQAGLVIANDSAPLHMAVGFDRPCIGLFGPTDPAFVGPYARAECVVRAYQPPLNVSRRAGSRPLHHFKDERLGDRLMRLISTAMVLQAVDRVLALWPQRTIRAFEAPSPAVAPGRSDEHRPLGAAGAASRHATIEVASSRFPREAEAAT